MHIRTHKIFPKEFPESWASDWGEDEYGLWMAFTYKNVRQSFRWCEPGTFMMGSPEDEPEHFQDELQHEVTLSKGFWMADTSVTQALWEAVMGENSSRFMGDERPVEKISWKDAQAFIDKMNGLKPSLKLCLPTEAQWEYACRADSITPFCWGEYVDSILVNFNGNYPYHNDQKSKNREQTVEVKVLPCNDWGLHQMHGNVWEWCQDWFANYPMQSVVDPRRPIFRRPPCVTRRLVVQRRQELSFCLPWSRRSVVSSRPHWLPPCPTALIRARCRRSWH